MPSEYTFHLHKEAVVSYVCARYILCDLPCDLSWCDKMYEAVLLNPL